MAKCDRIGRIRATITVIQAVQINNLECNQQTVWDLSAIGGESYTTDFTIDNNSSNPANVEWDISGPTDAGYTIEIYDGVTPITSPITIAASTSKSLTLKISFDQNIRGGAYSINIDFDYSS